MLCFLMQYDFKQMNWTSWRTCVHAQLAKRWK